MRGLTGPRAVGFSAATLSARGVGFDKLALDRTVGIGTNAEQMVSHAGASAGW
jgi:hypothetical protein